MLCLILIHRLEKHARLGITYGAGDAKELYSQYAPNDVLFKAMTNFTPTQFQNLLAKLMDPAMPRSYILKPRDPRGGRGLARQRRTRGGRPHKLSPATRLFLCLVRLKDDDRLVRLCAMSGLNVASVCDNFWHVCECLLAATEDQIRWPGAAERNTLARQAGALTRFGVVGVVDGTVQYICRPGADEPLYYNGRKKRHFLNHLVVCDWRGCIRAIRVGFYGRTHDSVAYKSCDLYTNKQAYFAQGQRLIADCGFMGCGNVTVPYVARPTLTQGQRAFNREVRRQRVVIEFLFGAMKSKFRILSGTWRHGLHRANSVFALCCQLTNMYMHANRRYIRGQAWRHGQMLEGWEEALLRQFGGDWSRLNRVQVREYLQSPAAQHLFDNW